MMTNVDGNLVDDLEDDFFSSTNILSGMRLGRYLERNGEDFSYSFTGKITDFNAWSTSLASQDLLDWTRCKKKLNPDLGKKNILIDR